MKHVDEFRQEEASARLAAKIQNIVTRPWRIMEVCGGQTHTILQYGIEDLLPREIELLHGPGCPVCVTPVEMIDKAVEISQYPDVIMCSYGDMLRVPGSSGDLLGARARGADVRTVYSPLDALKLAQKNPDKRVVFFAVGFETTAPANAMSVYQANRLMVSNFSILCSHVTVPPIMESILSSADSRIEAFIGPGHVCCITGSDAYSHLSQTYRIPIVIAGFEPIDILNAIYHCVRQLETGAAFMQNEYARAVRREGNQSAVKIVDEVFCVSDKDWRGLGMVPRSGLRLSEQYSRYDAQTIFSTTETVVVENALCISGEILKGLKKPPECSAFGTTCTPETPLGATMVSSEGTCANYFKFGKVSIKSKIQASSCGGSNE